jgi:hypothetical protein
MKFRINHSMAMYMMSMLFFSAALGCGGSSTVPDKATITINGPSDAVTISADTVFDYTVVVRYSDGTPIPKAKLRITGAFAEPRNSTNTNPRYQFYYNSGGPLAAGNIKVASGFEAQTDDWGIYSFSVNAYGLVNGAANSFADTIEVYSGTAIGSISLKVN